MEPSILIASIHFFEQLRVLYVNVLLNCKNGIVLYNAYNSCLHSMIQRTSVKQETSYSLRARHYLQRIRVHSMHLCVYEVRLSY